ncbi:hypothetical protein A2U01_0065912, partial [Trifolium medium]|nr:hypothetical protein [Trifolium medium]
MTIWEKRIGNATWRGVVQGDDGGGEAEEERRSNGRGMWLRLHFAKKDELFP